MTSAGREYSNREKIRKELQADGHYFPDAFDIAGSTGDGFIYTFDQLSGPGEIGFGGPGGQGPAEK